MNQNNPYAAPAANLADAKPELAHDRKRPVWVWIITIFYMFGALSAIISQIAVATGLLAVPAEVREYYASRTVLLHVLGFIPLLLNVVAAVLLWRLRKAAFTLFCLTFAMGAAFMGVQLLTGSYPISLFKSTIGSQAIGWVVGIMVIAYTYHLMRRGTLR
jgi:hypothetical protein